MAIKRKYTKNLYIIIFMLVMAGHVCGQLPGGPPDAQPGKCYALCFIPDIYQTVADQVDVTPRGMKSVAEPALLEPGMAEVLVKEAAKTYVVVPAGYQATDRKIVVREAGKQPVLVPAVYETVSTPVSVKPETRRLSIVPAQYDTVVERIMVRPATKRFVVTPPVYETRAETYEVEPAYSKIEVQAPKFVNETFLVTRKAAATEWVRRLGDPNCLQTDPADCFVWCLVETPEIRQPVLRRVNRGCDASGEPDAGCVRTTTVPAKTAPVSVRRVKTPASVREENVPAEYQTITRYVLKTPASVREETLPDQPATLQTRVLRTPASVREEAVPAEVITVVVQSEETPAAVRDDSEPAEYRSMPVKKLVRDATVRSEPYPREFATVERRNLIKAGGFSEWREVLCGERVTAYTVSALQRALKGRGYFKGNVDGRMTAVVRRALTDFQREAGLPVGQLDVETLQALGITY